MILIKGIFVLLTHLCSTVVNILFISIFHSIIKFTINCTELHIIITFDKLFYIREILIYIMENGTMNWYKSQKKLIPLLLYQGQQADKQREQMCHPPSLKSTSRDQLQYPYFITSCKSLTQGKNLSALISFLDLNKNFNLQHCHLILGLLTFTKRL